ncbi:hypothetical protein L3Q82_021733, partial [Scortum barcoo]
EHQGPLRRLDWRYIGAPTLEPGLGLGLAGERLVAGSLPTGTRPGSARNGDVGPPSSRLTTRRKVHEGPVQCGLGSSRGGGPRRPNPWTKTLAIGTWNVTSLGGKEPELVREVERYRLEIVGLTSTHSLGSGTQLLERGWTLHYSGVAQGERRSWCGLACIAPQLSRHVLEFTPVNERVASLRLRHKGVHQCTWHQDTLGWRSMIDFVVISSDLRPYVLDTRVKRGAELVNRSPPGGTGRPSKPQPGQVLEAKTRVWEEFGEAMEEDYRLAASKRFWQTVRRLRRGKQYSANTVYSAGGELLTSTGDIVGRWKKYFEDLLNPTDLPSNEEAEAGVSEVDSSITQAEVTEVVRKLLCSGKAPGVDEIRPEYLKSLDVVGLSWLTRLCNIAWRLGTVPLVWQTGVVVPLFKKGDRRVCSNYRGITLLSLPGKVYARVLERRIRPIVDPRIQEEQCGFRPGRGTLDQLYTLHRVLEGLWEFAQPVHMCFVDLEKAFDRVPRGILWGVLHAVWGPGAFAKGCSVSVRPEQELGSHCRQISRRSQGPEGVRFGNHRISSLLFADDVVLMASSGQDLQHVLERFAAECEAAGMRISTSKLRGHGSRPEKGWRALSRVGGEVLPQVEEFKYLGVLFTSEGKMEREIDRRIGAASAVMRSGVPDRSGKEGAEAERRSSRFTGQSTFPPSPMVMNFG